MKKYILTLVLLFFAQIYFLSAQNLVGYSVNEIKKVMPKIRPTFELDESTLESKNPSIKYSDPDGDNTLMFFIDQDGLCKYCKFMLETDLAKHAVDTLTKNYKYIDKLTWRDTKGRKDCVIQMVNSEWFFTIIIKEE